MPLGRKSRGTPGEKHVFLELCSGTNAEGEALQVMYPDSLNFCITKPIIISLLT